MACPGSVRTAPFLLWGDAMTGTRAPLKIVTVHRTASSVKTDVAAADIPASPKPKLLDQLREALRSRHYSRRTDATYVHWVKQFIFFHHVRHPQEMAEPEINAFLTHLAVTLGILTDEIRRDFPTCTRCVRPLIWWRCGSYSDLLGTIFATLWFAAIAIAAADCIVLYSCFLLAGYVMTNNRLKDLKLRAMSPVSVQVDGRYTNPPTWGVYKVEGFKDGVQWHAFHIGNHPVRQTELVRKHGAAELALLFTSRTDAEKLKFLINSGRLCVK